MIRYAVIGAGSSGLATARALHRRGIEVDGYESSPGVDYPGHRAPKTYFQEYVDRFGLTALFRFNTRVTRLEPHDGGWNLANTGPNGDEMTR